MTNSNNQNSEVGQVDDTLEKIFLKLDKLDSLERKLDSATNQVTEDLALIK